jgi:hypothetical protein
MEYWNTGTLGSGRMRSWVIVTFLFTGIKWRNVIYFKSSFHYSIIPLFHVQVKSIRLKNIFIFIILQNFRDVKLIDSNLACYRADGLSNPRESA